MYVAVDVGDGANDDTADGPEHLQHLRRRCPQLDRHNLAAVCRCVGNEDSPGQTFENLGSKDYRKGFGEVEDENEDIQEHQTSQGGPAVPDATGQRASNKDTDECAKLAGHLECALPLRWDDMAVAWHVCAICVLELWKGDEVANEEDVVGFHDL